MRWSKEIADQLNSTPVAIDAAIKVMANRTNSSGRAGLIAFVLKTF